MNFTLITNDVNGQQATSTFPCIGELLSAISLLTRMGAPVATHVIVDGFARIAKVQGDGMVPAEHRAQIQEWHKEAKAQTWKT